MSVTISTPLQICNSPLNASSSKMLYSFSKGDRFGSEKKQLCTQFCYDLPPLKNRRTTSLGYGSKYDFTQNKTQQPAPDAYNLKDFVTDNKKKGFSFGLSRDAMLISGGQYVGDKTAPGPNAYDVREKNKVAISYTFKARTPGPEKFSTTKLVPGPGAYSNYVTLTPKGIYSVSKFKNSCAATFAPSRSSRFPSLKANKTPGPGTYELEAAISPVGDYFVSKFKDSGVRTFSHSMRGSNSVKSLNVTPGPGTYKIPSDFGHYEAANAKKFEEEVAKTQATEKNDHKEEDKTVEPKTDN